MNRCAKKLEGCVEIYCTTVICRICPTRTRGILLQSHQIIPTIESGFVLYTRIASLLNNCNRNRRAEITAGTAIIAIRSCGVDRGVVRRAAHDAAASDRAGRDGFEGS